jgi:hypothetical protein
MTVKIVVPMPERSSFCGFICLARMLKMLDRTALALRRLWGAAQCGASHPNGMIKLKAN